jgi:hypothetical protein
MAQEQLAADMGDYLKANCFDFNAAGLTPEQRLTRKADFDALMQAGGALTGAAVGAVVGGTAGAATGASVALTGITNNYLKHIEVTRLASQLKACGDDQTCRDEAFATAQQVSATNDAALLNCKAAANCDALKVEYRQGYAAVADLVSAGMPVAEVQRVLTLETNAQTIIRNGLDQRMCVTQACQDNAKFIAGMGKGLSLLSPAGLVAGTGVLAYELTTAIINNGATDTAVDREGAARTTC